MECLKFLNQYSNSIDSKYHICGTEQSVIFMCANDEEKQYLKSLGFIVNGYIDYFKIIKTDVLS